MSDGSGPSTAAIAIATAILSLATGYFLGTASSLFHSKPPARKPKKGKPSWPNNYDVTIHPDSSDEELMASLGRTGDKKEVEDSEDESSRDSTDGEAKGEISAFEGNNEECKLVLVVRNDLGMGKGKIAAQCCHATLSNYLVLAQANPNHPVLLRWKRTGQAKIATQCSSEDELHTLQATALSLGLSANIVHDAGRTQITAGSATVLGVGPGPRSVVDQVTGGLKLL